MSRRESNQVRIIGGQHRGRRLSFPDQLGLRPTGDRVRETLFNWLQPWISGARCLDLFAGSGALGIEAASRGAASVVMVEQAAPVVRVLRESIARLGLEQLELVQGDALQWLEGTPQPFDIVFLDPPFADRLLGLCGASLQEGWLVKGALVYIEIDASDELPELPENWELLKQKKAGQVRFYLFRVASP